MQKTLTTHRRSTGYVHYVLRVNKGTRVKIASGDQTEIVEHKDADGRHYRVVVDSRKFGNATSRPVKGS